jgi:hypothetical protein
MERVGLGGGRRCGRGRWLVFGRRKRRERRGRGGVLAARGDGEAMAAAAGVLAGGYYAHFCGSGGLGREVAEGTVVDRVHSSIRNEMLEDVVVSSSGKRRATREKKFEDVWTRADSVNLHHHHQLQSICGASFISLKWEG